MRPAKAPRRHFVPYHYLPDSETVAVFSVAAPVTLSWWRRLWLWVKGTFRRLIHGSIG